VQVIWAPEALADARRIYDYIAEFNPIAARRVVGRFATASQELARFPYRGRSAVSYRELTVVHPYVMLYDVHDTQVEILRIWHGAQDRGV
jgi:addiction module RelE/StbE family toxin